jgi:hypothetical protein
MAFVLDMAVVLDIVVNMVVPSVGHTVSARDAGVARWRLAGNSKRCKIGRIYGKQNKMADEGKVIGRT